MILLRAATVTVSDLARSVKLYGDALDYRVLEEGAVDAGLAASWDAPATAGRPYAILAPVSGADIYLRLIEQPPVDAFKALRTFGWNAIEICVTDVEAVDARMQASDFEIIGPPRKNAGLANIHPMQVKGPDEEVVFLTQINSDTPPYKLPRATSLIDQIFILVMGCRDLEAGVAWMASNLGVSPGVDIEIAYTMLAKAYGETMDTTYRLITMTHDNDVFLEMDQYPDAAVERPALSGMLAPGCAIGTFWTPDFDQLPQNWIAPPAARGGPIYKDRRCGTKRTPDGALVEIVEG